MCSHRHSVHHIGLESHTIGAAFQEMTGLFASADLSTPALDARVLICQACEISQEEFYLQPERKLSIDKQKLLCTYIERRLKREPVSRILGYREFWGRRFEINQATLDPRADTETLVGFVLDYVKENKSIDDHLKILDLGTGSGCILLSLLCELKNAIGIGIDISIDALEIARHNAVEMNVFDRVQFVKANWLDPIYTGFDIIVSNPPYIPSKDIPKLMVDVCDYDPYASLNGGPDGLNAYRNIIDQIRNLPGCLESWVAFEVGIGQAEEIENMFIKNGCGLFFDIMHKADLSGHKRCIAARFENRTNAN